MIFSQSTSIPSLRVYETGTPQHKLYMHCNQTLDYVLDNKRVLFPPIR